MFQFFRVRNGFVEGVMRPECYLGRRTAGIGSLIRVISIYLRRLENKLVFAIRAIHGVAPLLVGHFGTKEKVLGSSRGIDHGAMSFIKAFGGSKSESIIMKSKTGTIKESQNQSIKVRPPEEWPVCFILQGMNFEAQATRMTRRHK